MSLTSREPTLQRAGGIPPLGAADTPAVLTYHNAEPVSLEQRRWRGVLRTVSFICFVHVLMTGLKSASWYLDDGRLMGQLNPPYLRPTYRLIQTVNPYLIGISAALELGSYNKVAAVLLEVKQYTGLAIILGMWQVSTRNILVVVSLATIAGGIGAFWQRRWALRVLKYQATIGLIINTIDIWLAGMLLAKLAPEYDSPLSVKSSRKAWRWC